MVCAFGSCRSTLPAFDKPRPRRRVSRRTRWSSSLVVCRLAFFSSIGGCRFLCPIGAVQPLPSITTTLSALRFGILHFPDGFLEPVSRGMFLITISPTLRFGILHLSAGVLFLSRVRPRYDLGSCIFLMVLFCTVQPRCYFYYEFVNVTIWDPASPS